MERIILGACGLGIWAFGAYLKKLNVDSNAKFSKLVNAKVIGLKEAGPYDRGRKTYYPTLKFTFEDKTYITDGNEFVSDVVKIGDVYSIFIDPNCPRNVRLVKGGETFSSIAAKIFGGFMILSAILLKVLE